MLAYLVKEIIRTNEAKPNNKVSLKDYDSWAAGFIFEAMRDQRYGQSFCNKFNIHDYILYYTSTVEEADQYIRKNYIA
jgi:hypothetical protein